MTIAQSIHNRVQTVKKQGSLLVQKEMTQFSKYVSVKARDRAPSRAKKAF